MGPFSQTDLVPRSPAYPEGLRYLNHRFHRLEKDTNGSRGNLVILYTEDLTPAKVAANEAALEAQWTMFRRLTKIFSHNMNNMLGALAGRLKNVMELLPDEPGLLQSISLPLNELIQYIRKLNQVVSLDNLPQSPSNLTGFLDMFLAPPH